MKPGRPLKRRRPIWEGPAKPRGRARKRERAKRRHAKHFGDFAVWIRELPCAVCCGPWLPWVARDLAVSTGLGWEGKQLGRTVPAHGPGMGRGAHPEREAKGSIIPLCQPHHGTQHAIGWTAFQSRHNLDAVELAQRCARRYDEEVRADGDDDETTDDSDDTDPMRGEGV